MEDEDLKFKLHHLIEEYFVVYHAAKLVRLSPGRQAGGVL